MVPGMIMLWNSSVATIPSGWHLCDGTMGTPSLQGLFVVGAGVGLAPGTVGGNQSHDHDFTGDGHAHDLGAGNDIGGLSPAGDHNHHTDTQPSSGTTDPVNHLPPYYALCYIQKL